jgi:hypothetical protein
MNEISQELKSILSKSGFGEYMDTFEFNDIFEVVIPAILDNLNSRLESTLNAIDCMNQKDYVTARTNLGIHDQWCYLPEKPYSARAIVKSLITGFLHIHHGYLKSDPTKVYKIWEHYVPMYVPNVKRFYSIDCFFPHPGNINNFCFHHFINYQRFLRVSDHHHDTEKFMVFFHNYIFEMLFMMANELINESRNLLIVSENDNEGQLAFFKEGTLKNEQYLLHFNNISKARNQDLINESFMKFNVSSPGVRNIISENRLIILSGNSYEQIPSEIIQNAEIKELIIFNSNIDRIPDEIKNMQNLERFHFSGSRLKYLSPEVFKLPKIIDVDVIDPYFYPDDEITVALGYFMERNTHRFFGENIWNLEVWRKF